MEYFVIIFLFVIACFLAYIEDLIPSKYKNIIFVAFGVILLFTAGLKEIGLDPDSENYAAAYRSCYAENKQQTYEFSYKLVCQILNNVTENPCAVFFFYAFWGILLKFIAMYRYDKNRLILYLAIYLSFFFEVHEMMQIRTAILSGLFLNAVIEIQNKKRLLAFLLILIGFCFHTSAIVLLPFLFFPTKHIGRKERIFLIAFVVMSLGLSVSAGGILDLCTNLPYIGHKIALYSTLADYGLSVNRVNGFGIFNLLSVAIAIYLIYFSDTITKKDPRFPLILRIYVCGVAVYTLLSFIPELGARVSALYKTVSILAFANIIYTIKPRWAAIALLQLMLLIFLHYGLQVLGMDFLWATEL